MKNRTIGLGILLLATGVTLQGCLPDISAIAEGNRTAHLFEGDAGTGESDFSAQSPIGCELRTGRGTARSSLEALIIANDASVGRFTLELERKGPSGSSRISQGGDFDLSAGETEQIGRVMLDGGGRIKADLLVHDDDGEILCEASYPSDRKPAEPKKTDLDEVFET